MKWKKIYGKETKETEKIRRLLFSARVRERERVFSRLFGGGGTERGVRDGVVCVVVLKLYSLPLCAPSKRALKGKERAFSLV